MNVIYDVETTTFQKGNPFSKRNKLILAGFKYPTGEYSLGGADSFGYQDLDEHTLIGFNIKFDLHWAKRSNWWDYGDVNIWDVQLAHFMLTGQVNAYPSLNDVCKHYGHPEKLDVVKLEYWDKGIDTDQIPRNVLEKYLKQDLDVTELCYKSQVEEFKSNPALYKLFRLACRDLLVLADMEWNGLPFNEQLAQEKSDELERQISNTLFLLNGVYANIPIDWNSVDDLSCFLYGGVIEKEERYQVGVFKTGEKIGQPRYKINVLQFPLPQLVKPIKGSELKKEGYWSTDDKTLKQLKGSKRLKEIISWITAYRENSKLRNTYFQGYLDLRKEMDWPEGELHGNFNQCVARTGRLSSTKPNLQNPPPEAQELLGSSY
jgi:DNA polymerase I-like protein with 3'-5' exonuclease and polymerase domains